MARRACLLIFWAVAEPLAVSGFAPRAAGLDHRLRLAQQRDVAAFAAPPAAYADLFARFDKLDAKLQVSRGKSARRARSAHPMRRQACARHARFAPTAPPR